MKEYDKVVIFSKEAEDRFNSAPEAIQKTVIKILTQHLNDVQLKIIQDMKEKETDFTIPSIPC